MDSKIIDAFRDNLDRKSEFVIVTHTNPDGDAIGSSLAMYHYLRNKGIPVTVITPNHFPDFLKWLPGSDNILIFTENEKPARQKIEKAGFIFCLDFSELQRAEGIKGPVQNSKAPKLLIDHHRDPKLEEFDYTISTTKVSSTAELIFGFLDSLGELDQINKNIALSIYAGIMTDTGSFSYACNYPGTFRAAAFLIEKGVDAELVYRLVYSTYSENRMRLLGFCLSERLTVLPEYHTAYIYLTKEDLERFDYKIGDTEGVVNYALSINNVVFAVLFMHRDNVVRLSLRSKGRFPVNEIARKHFKGGGHRNASGADSDLPMQETIDKFRSLLPEYQAALEGNNELNI